MNHDAEVMRLRMNNPFSKLAYEVRVRIHRTYL